MFIDKAFDEISKKNKVAIGFDLGNEFSQISFCRTDQSMPDTFSLVMGDEQYNIPTLLCKMQVEGGTAWAVGNEAVKAAGDGKGILVENLLSPAVGSAIQQAGEDEVETQYLLGIFIQKVLGKVTSYMGTDNVGSIVFTLAELNQEIMELIKKCIKNTTLQKVQVYFMSHEDCFFQYIIHQPEEMWVHDVVLYDYNSEGIESQILQVNRKTSPVVCFIETKTFPHMKMPDLTDLLEEEKKQIYDRYDSMLMEILHEQCDNRAVTSIFLLGDNFSGHWCNESLKYMCKSRRVFQGNNLFSKGACYGAREKLIPSTLVKEYVYLSEEKLRANIGMKCNKGQEEIYFPILNAGTNWYDAICEFDVMLMKNNVISFTVSPLDGNRMKVASISLDGLKVRGNRTNRVGLKFYMENNKELKIEIKDKGFGEIFPSTGQVWKETLVLDSL